MIPVGSRFPEEFDDDTNLYLVKDSLRARLSQDYNVGDSEVYVEADVDTLAKWPTVGWITLTEQCSDIDKRAVTLHYDELTVSGNSGVFSGLLLRSGTESYYKAKRITNVLQNVIDAHHNQLKDAVIAIQEFVGVKGEEDTEPFGDTLEGRVNFLRRKVLTPKAWFVADRQVGVVPFEVTFTERCFKLATDGTEDELVITWDFGDNTSSTVSLISATSEVPDGALDVLVYDEDQGSIKKTYLTPGIYGVTLTVSNEFGEDEVYFPDFITARVEAPKEAIVQFEATDSAQIVTAGTPSDGPFTTTPHIKSPINTIINTYIEEGENPSIPGYSYTGELLNGSGTPFDPVEAYTWSFGDDLEHGNAPTAKASYSIGGLYDLKLRVDTEFGAYRITTYEDAIEIVEDVNLWLWTYSSSNTVRAYEFGLLSETFKLTTAGTQVVTRNNAFLNGVPNETYQKQEFRKNVGFTVRGSTPSGQQGSGLFYYASGRGASDPISSEKINLIEYNGFLDVYTTRTPMTRPWNWVSLNAPGTSYFLFGSPTTAPAINTSPVNMSRQELSMSSLTVNSVTMTTGDLTNATELEENLSEFESDGSSTYGHYSVYRSAWKDDVGYIVRNSGVGPFFRLRSFYRTSGTVGSPIQTIERLTDLIGTVRYEGELVTLVDGVYFFNNTGSVSRYDDSGGTWYGTGPGLNSSAFRKLQDITVDGSDSDRNTLLAASDSDRRAYLSYDYSTAAFIKFDQITKTFSSIGTRPTGEQFVMGVF